MTKHAKLLRYIKQLKVGTKISVRLLAAEHNVSEGTAYRAIKDAQLEGYVYTMPRVGTIRIEQKSEDSIEKLSFGEVVNIVDGTVLGGKEGLHKPLNKFLIGAMELAQMDSYIEPESLLIVGNRIKAQTMALNRDVAVLITGGFIAADEIIDLANAKKMPLISSSYDTFTVATMINQAIYKRLVRKEVMRVSDAMVKNPKYIEATATIGDLKELIERTRHSKFPVVGKNHRVVGVITNNDISDLAPGVLVQAVMSKDPIVVSEDSPVAHVARLMVWEGIKIVPVVRGKRLIAVITRKDAIKALQHLSFQPQMGETLDGMIMSRFSVSKTEDGVILKGKTDPIMLNPQGIVGNNALMTLMANAGAEAFRIQRRIETVTDSISVYFSKPVQLEQDIEVEAIIIDMGRRSGKAEISLFHSEKLVAKAMISVRVISK